MISKHRRLLTGTPSILSPLREAAGDGPRNPSLPVMSPLHRTYLIPLWMLMQLIPATISKSDADDEATEEDILNNNVADDDEDDEMDDEEG